MAEATALKQSLPATLEDPSARRYSRYGQRPPLLHRILASGIAHVFLFLALILPLAKHLCQWARRHEQEHRTCERILVGLLNLSNVMLAWAVLGLRRMVKTIDVNLIKDAMEFAVGLYENCVEGIKEGVAEGTAILKQIDDNK